MGKYDNYLIKTQRNDCINNTTYKKKAVCLFFSNVISHFHTTKKRETGTFRLLGNVV